ncbi:MAG: hypothetical protein ACLTBV_27660 [Enterocloster bolteae]
MDNFGMGALCPDGKTGGKDGGKGEGKDEGNGIHPGCRIFLAGLLLAWKLELKIPSDLIPSRWSDFEFWSGKIEELRSDMAAVGRLGMSGGWRR